MYLLWLANSLHEEISAHKTYFDFRCVHYSVFLYRYCSHFHCCFSAKQCLIIEGSTFPPFSTINIDSMHCTLRYYTFPRQCPDKLRVGDLMQVFSYLRLRMAE